MGERERERGEAGEGAWEAARDGDPEGRDVGVTARVAVVEGAGEGECEAAGVREMVSVQLVDAVGDRVSEGAREGEGTPSQ